MNAHVRPPAPPLPLRPREDMPRRPLSERTKSHLVASHIVGATPPGEPARIVWSARQTAELGCLVLMLGAFWGAWVVLP
jgi:hypothetical protein